MNQDTNTTLQISSRLFDIKIESERIRTALMGVKSNQQPGQLTNRGTKTEVLSTVKQEIKQLIDEGYTPKQIAEAISKEVFGILPKTITQLIKNKPKPASKQPSSKQKKSTRTELPPTTKTATTMKHKSSSHREIEDVE